MKYQKFVVASLLLLALLMTAPAGTSDIALILVVAFAALVLSAGCVEALRLLHRSHVSGPSSDERHLRGSFRRQHRPDAAGRPQPRAPGTLVGALQN